MELTCQQCGSVIAPATIRPGRTRLCSTRCKSKWQGLPPWIVIAILRSTGSGREVAHELEVSPMSVSRIRRGLRHRNIFDEATR